MIVLLLPACIDIICFIFCTASIAQSLNHSYIRQTADRLSRRLSSFTDAVLQPRALRDIYTSVDYDLLQINGNQVVSNLSNTLGKLEHQSFLLVSSNLALV